MIRLPIDERVGEIVAAVRAKNLVLVAEPGAGKTTRVPRALLDAGLLGDSRCVVLEPRRLAARMAARRVAEELSDVRDKRVGWQVRFEDTTSKETRIAFVTEGILTRRFVSDPELRGTSIVVLDEFHERHLHADVALALLRRLQLTKRPDLRIIGMSATLEAERVAAFLDAEVMHVKGRRFDVTHEYLDKVDDKYLDAQVASALRNVLARPDVTGDVLVFLPGAGEIRRAKEACTDIAARAGIDLVTLHGDLPADEQDRAVRPGPRRKVILSTNVAESSVTIEGVGVVIDSGQARVASHSAWTGMPKLVTSKISQASAVQRAGRAGRLREGVCIRLYTKYDFETRPKHDVPEIKRADLAETALHLHALGERELASFPWFESPIPAALEAASRLLLDLGAVHEGTLTAIGKRMQNMPVHPRAARLLLEAKDREVGPRGAMLAALLGEREIRARARTQLHAPRSAKENTSESGDSDLIARLLDLEAVEALGMSPSRLRQHELDPAAAQAVVRSRDQLARALGVGTTPQASLEDEEDALLHATLAAFPDRVGRRARALGAEVAFARGGGASLAEDSEVREAQFLVAVDVEERRGTNVIRLASKVDPEWLLEMFPNEVRDGSSVRFDPKTERVESVSALMYGSLALDESKRSDVRNAAVGACLAKEALARGPASFCDADALLLLQRRAAFVAQHRPDFPALDDEAIARAVNELAVDLVALSELRDANVIAHLLASLPQQARTALDRDAPTHVTLPGGRRTPVQYEPGKPPFIESRLQDFFGMKTGPALVDGRVPLVIHLLAPNQRAVQVTTDLAGFWDRHYPTIKKELMRKYPRHSWPDDPRTAQPPPPKPPRR